MISNDGKLMVTGSSDRNIKKWDAKTGKAIGKPMEGNSDSIRSLAISTDGNLIVSGSYRNMRRWDLRTGEQIGDNFKLPGRIGKLVLSIDSQTTGC